MRAEKYDRKVTLNCPTCGGIVPDQYLLKCTSCDREFTKDEILRANSANLQKHKIEIGKEVLADFEKEMRNMFKRTFSGNKYIKFR